MLKNKPDLSDQTAFITGTTRGIGKAIALALAECGCNIVSTGKTVDDQNSPLSGTIQKTAEACEEKNVDALAVQLDLRDEEQVQSAVDRAISEFGEINIVINNASALHFDRMEDFPVRRFDLVHEVNTRGTFLVCRAFADHLKSVDPAWILTNSPPIEMDRGSEKAPYLWSKMGMSFLTLSMAEELRSEQVGCNCFWPVTAIRTRATEYFGLGSEEDWRRPEIVSDAVLEILKRDPASFTGQSLTDEELLRDAGVDDFSAYSVVEGTNPPPFSMRLFDPDYERPE